MSGPSKYRRAAEFLVNTAVKGAAAAASKAQGEAAKAAAKAESTAREVAEVRRVLTCSMPLVYEWPVAIFP